MEGTVDPFLFVILGGTGDLAGRKLLPALAHLEQENRLGRPHALLGVARDREMTEGAYRDWAVEAFAEAGIDIAVAQPLMNSRQTQKRSLPRSTTICPTSCGVGE